MKKFKPRKADAPDGTWRMAQRDIDRVQEFRKFIGPRFFVSSAALEMHSLDTDDRIADMKHKCFAW